MVLEKHIQQSLMSNDLDMSEFSEEVNRVANEIREKKPLTDKQLSEKLESLPPEKKEALLELLG